MARNESKTRNAKRKQIEQMDDLVARGSTDASPSSEGEERSYSEDSQHSSEEDEPLESESTSMVLLSML